MPFRPKSFYGEQNVVYSVACGAAAGQLAAIGAKTGGVHGNPRVSTWYVDAAGEFQEVIAGLEQYGGNEGVNAARMAGGPSGYLIAGNRASGAAVWLSPDAQGFELVEKRPVMTNEGSTRTTANDAVPAGPGWLVVGGELRADRPGRDPVVWTSPDGRNWTRAQVPAAAEDEILMRVVPAGEGLVAAGTRGEAFGLWLERSGRWEPTGRFGVSRGAVAAGVGGVAVSGDGVFVVTASAEGHRMWRSGRDGRAFRTVESPVDVPAGGTTSVGLSAIGDQVLLLTDDGRAGGVWLANSGVG